MHPAFLKFMLPKENNESGPIQRCDGNLSASSTLMITVQKLNIQAKNMGLLLLGLPAESLF